MMFSFFPYSLICVDIIFGRRARESKCVCLRVGQGERGSLAKLTRIAKRHDRQLSNNNRELNVRYAILEAVCCSKHDADSRLV